MQFIDCLKRSYDHFKFRDFVFFIPGNQIDTIDIALCDLFKCNEINLGDSNYSQTDMTAANASNERNQQVLAVLGKHTDNYPQCPKSHDDVTPS